MLHSLRLLPALALLTLSPAALSAGCGPEPEPCKVAGGLYHAELPERPAEGHPGLVFLHGWGSSGEATLRNRGMVEAALARGYAVIAPSGVPRAGGNGRTWGFHPRRPGPRDEIAFLTRVADDAADRFGLDRDGMLAAGFSIGGSMVAYLACGAPGSFAAYAPVGGNFWRPHPERCAGPVRLFHTHGWRDGTVPLEGRLLRGDDLNDPDAVAQGDIWQAMQIWRETDGCRLKADRYSETGIYWRRGWEDCADGASLDFALHPGGHSIPEGWTDMALDWFEEVTARR